MELGKARELADAWFSEAVDLLRELARIPAPTGQEDARAEFVAGWLRAAGAERVEVDDAKNVLCWVSESPGAGIELFSAHTDVVFDDLTPLPLREEGGRMYAPGVGDDTANLVCLLLGARWLLAHPEATAGRSILVVANSCEEGLGNLRGMRAVFDKYGARIASHVAFDHYLDGLVAEAVGSLRWRVSCDGPGGHSFKDFGRPNTIVELAWLVSALDAMELPAGARVTQNVGVISGGSTVNSIPEHAEMLYELRSPSNAALQEAREEFERVLARGHQGEGVQFSVELIGERPGNGPVDPDALAALVRRACEANEEVTGCAPITPIAGSTDINIPLSLGIPAVCMGAVRGSGQHTRGEWIETASLRDGLAVVARMLA